MEACSFIDFITVLKPWLNDDYIRKAGLDENGNFRLQFVDGGAKLYRVDDCTGDQIEDVIAMLQENGIAVEKL
jgi:hypothetical protein